MSLWFKPDDPAGAAPAPPQARSQVQLVIFDVDGTLVDSQNHIVEAQHRAFSALGLPAPTRVEALSVVGLSLHEAFAVLVGADGPCDELAAAYRDAWTDLRAEPSFHEPLFPKAGEAVAALRADPEVVLGIATGKARRGVDRLLNAQGWQGVFKTIQTADGHPSKPHPSMVLTAVEETGCDNKHAVMIGDTTYDMEMATAAGVRAIGVAWGYHSAEALRASGAERIVEDFPELLAALGRA